ncbi:hypothetical protein BH09ACT11_BH09ACT11_10920 [soil metagenome]
MLGAASLVLAALGSQLSWSADADDDLDQVRGPLVEFSANGGWCWYQDERVVVDRSTQTLLVGSVANRDGLRGEQRGGNVDLTAYTADGQVQTTVLHRGLENDDHVAPALWVRPDGRYLAMYTKHRTDRLVRYRISRNPHDARHWRPEQTFDFDQVAEDGFGVTYSNLIYLSTERRLYNFVRADGRSPNIMTSTDLGNTWRWRGRLTSSRTVGYVNGYFKYFSNGVDRIDVVATEHHPRNFNTSIYHGYIKAKMLHRSDGTVVDKNIFAGRSVAPHDLTPVWRADPEDGDQRLTRAWPTDIASDASGRPVITFTARADDVPVDSAGLLDHRFFYATWAAGRWRALQIARAGAALYEAEGDYTGLAAIDPSRTRRIYISTPVDPRSAEPTEHHEIYRGVTSDRGRSWQWTAVTWNSASDNLRPVVPVWRGRHAVLWLRGTYTTQHDYDLRVVGLV